MKTDMNMGQLPAHRNGSCELPEQGATEDHQTASPAIPEVLAYDIKQAAARLNASVKTVRRWLILGKLTSCRETRKILIPREQVENFYKRTCDKPALGV